jgi:hypothetical protein
VPKLANITTPPVPSDSALRFLARLDITALLTERLLVGLVIRSTLSERDHMVTNSGPTRSAVLQAVHTERLPIEQGGP